MSGVPNAWIISIFGINNYFEFRISCFEFSVFTFLKAEPIISDLALRTSVFRVRINLFVTTLPLLRFRF